MGSLDQFIKSLFEEETPLATHDGARFEVPPETRTTELHADGMLYLVNAEKLAELPLPWPMMKVSQLVLEFKMQGDKLDRYHYERAILRRQASQVEYIKKYPDDENPISLPLWIITGHKRSWFWEKNFILKEISPAIYRIEPASYEVYLVISNELEVREDLIPFLVTRTGQKLVDFCRWFYVTRPERGEEFLELAPMSDAQHEALMDELKEPELAERLRRKRRLAETMAEITGLQGELVQEGQKKTLTHQFEKRLARPLSEAESLQLSEKIVRLGADRVSDVVLELTKDALALWLSDPAAV